MPQKKKESLGGEKPGQEVHADHELFLQAFESKCWGPASPPPSPLSPFPPLNRYSHFPCCTSPISLTSPPLSPHLSHFLLPSPHVPSFTHSFSAYLTIGANSLLYV